MDQWLSLYTRIVALLEAIREREVTLEPSSLGALQSLVRFFCGWVCTASSDADLPPCLTATGPSSFPPQGWGKPGKKESFSPDPISEGEEEDACSVPDSLPDLMIFTFLPQIRSLKILLTFLVFSFLNFHQYDKKVLVI